MVEAVFVAGLALMGAQSALPDAFRSLPADVKDKATVVVSGRYQVGRGPCEFLPDGSSRFPLLRGFELTAVHRGDVTSDYLGVDDEPHLLGSDALSGGLEEGAVYLVLLRPSEATLKVLRRRPGSRSYRDALRAEEVVAIVLLTAR